uniref:Aromatic-L-amino-acid decarboxylase n=1 Tax=Clastoptera arizonana TaxID=38151 RepID=A0A1B6CN44_9HEMI
MDAQGFKEMGNATIDYIIDYHQNIRDRPVLPSIKPGYLRPMMPESMPQEPDQWQEVLKDMDKLIMPGVTHWSSPRFHSYYPSGMSYPSIVGEMISASLGVIGFSWMSSPACTELELVLMDWVAKAMDLPKEFLNSSDGPGGGIIQGSASEATLLGLIVAKDKTVRRIQELNPDLSEQEIKAKLVCYTSDQANSSVEKAGILASVPIRLLHADETGRLRGETLRAAIDKDKKNGLIPCYVVANLGTTGTCAFDALDEIGPICKQEDLWLHVDAAYAGSALVCPELRSLMPGIHHVDSIVINFHKWFKVSFDCSGMWFRNTVDVELALKVERIYLKHRSEGEIPDLRNWQIPLGRRFRSLKLWFTLRLYGLSGLQNYIRKHVAIAKHCEKELLKDSRFMLASPTSLGLVCLRLKGGDDMNTKLLEELNIRRNIYLIPASLNGHVFLRLVICGDMNDADITFTINEIKTAANIVIAAEEALKISEKENINATDNENNIKPKVESRKNSINIEMIKNSLSCCTEKCSIKQKSNNLNSTQCYINPAHS